MYFIKYRKVRKYKNQLVHESDFLEIDGYFLKSMYILAPTIDTTSNTPHAISNIMPVSNKKEKVRKYKSLLVHESDFDEKLR